MVVDSEAREELLKAQRAAGGLPSEVLEETKRRLNRGRVVVRGPSTGGRIRVEDKELSDKPIS